MLALEERFMIRDLYRTGVSISEIARRTGRERKTIRQITAASEMLAPKRARKLKARKIDPYIPYLERRIAEGVLNARKLYGEVLTQGYEGKESQVREFVHHRRVPKEPGAAVRFETAPGEQGQVDWGSFGTIEHQGRTCRLYAFVLTLGWSRAMYVRFTISVDTTWFIRCHLHAFAYLGGLPRTLLYDNLKSVVERRESSGTIHWNPRFLDFADVAGFRLQACRPYRPQTKGKVESGVKYVRRNFWPGLHFGSLDELNQQAETWLNTVANCRVHGTTGEVPSQRLPQEGLLSAAKALGYDTSLRFSRQVSRDCCISYEGNLYSVPATFARQLVQVKVTETDQLIVCSEQGQEVARHHLLRGVHQCSTQAEHYQSLRARSPQAAVPSPEPLTGEVPGLTAQLPLFWEAPVVEVRSLSVYEHLSQEAR